MAVMGAEVQAEEQQSTGQSTLRRLFKIKGVVIGSAILAFLVVGAVFAPWIAPYDPTAISRTEQLLPPGAGHVLGTDQLGRDVFSRLLFGSRLSLIVGFVSVGIGGGAGIVLGLISGFAGGWVDSFISGIVDIMLAFPGLLLALVIIIWLGPGLMNVMVAVGIGNTPRWARLVRSTVLSIKETDFVAAAKAAGATDSRIMFRHILGNILAPIIVFTTLGIGSSILSAASLGYLGLGAQPPTPEWGLMLSEARNFIRICWWAATFPGIAIMLSVLSVNMVGDGLRDTLDPRLRGRMS